MATSVTLEPIVVTASSKSLVDHLKDFYDGISNFVTAPYALGDYLARISGLRDWQLNGSVVPDMSVNYELQRQAVLESKATYEALKLLADHPEQWGTLLNAFIDGVKDKPAYYLGSILTNTAVSKTLLNWAEKAAYTSISTSGKTADFVNDVYKELQQMSGLSNDEFEKLINKDELLKKLSKDIGYLDENNLTFNPKEPMPEESDIDHDGIPDWLDSDMDGDGIQDAEDSDRDGDGIPDTEDSDPLTPQKPIDISISTSVVNENDGTISFTVRLSSVLTQVITIDLMTLDGSAVLGEDYGTTPSFTVSIPAGSTSATFSVPIYNNDDLPESTETFTLSPFSYTYGGRELILFTNTGLGVIIDDELGATPYDDVLILTDESDIMDALAGDDYVQGKGGSDMLYGNDGADIIFGDEGNDYVEGGAGDDLLFGGDGDDVLLGSEGSDALIGGSGFDMYVTDNGDVVADSDGQGSVFFENGDISGVKTKSDQGNFYEDDSNTYVNAGGLIVTSKTSGESITLSGWNNKDLGITLQDSQDIEVWVGDATAMEAEEMMRIDVALQRVLLENETVTVDLGYYTPTYKWEATGNMITVPASPGYTSRSYDTYTETWSVYTIPARDAYVVPETRKIQTGESFNAVGSVTFEPGDQVQTFTYTWKDDDSVGVHTGHPNPLTLTAKTNEEISYYSDDIKVIAMNSGTETITDDDEAGRIDPLVLDTNRDGFISTTPLTGSTTYFDMTGDGLRERVGWVSPEDALLTYDKNDNGQIDGIDEIFGSLTESGFEELKRLIDANHDNKIDRKDELFAQLQLWHDNNQDGRVQEGELKSLSQEGVTSVDLNYVSTRIEIEGNLLTEASKYSTDGGTKELVADIQLATDVADTKVDIADIPGFTIDESTRTLPGLKGSGQVYDAFILYNTNNEFKALSEVLASDSAQAFSNFEGYVEQWSGYTKYVDQLKERYSLSDDFTMQEGDKHAWIVDRFSGKDDSTSTIQNYYNTGLNNGKVPTSAIVNDAKINTKYTTLLEKTQSSFIILSQYQELFSDTHYDIATDRFVIDDNTAFNTKIDNYLNDSTKTIEEKLHLASVMQMQRQGLNFEIDNILGGIDNNITKTLIRDIYASKGVAFLASEIVDNSGVLLGSQGDDVVKTADTNAKILSGAGNDTIQSGKGHNTFFFRRGDGADVISDTGGIDSLIFDEGINRDAIIIKLNRNSDLVIALKEEGKTFEELTDKVTIVDWMKAANRIEEIRFGDGSQLKFKEVFALFEATDTADVLQLSTGNDTINSGGGNDVITALMGNDTIIGGQGDDRLDGGVGNDAYIFNRGDGKDTIIDSGGYDTLQFTAGITNDDLIAKLQGTDLLIAIKEEGKTFAQLSDVITLKNYKNTKETIEAVFLEGYRRVDIQALLNAPTNENDTLVLGDTNDTIDLLAGDDTLQAGGGNDTITGGKGSDRLEGGEGDDTYLFNRGDGKDTIYDDSSFGNNNSRKINAGNDTLRFGEGISQDDLIIQYVGSDLIIGLKEDGKEFNALGDSVTIVNYTDANDKIENILFSDGSKVIINEIKNGTAGNDTLNFKDKSEDLVLQGLGGRDFIHGGSGNDNLQGNAGTDDIYGGAGDDTIIGGQESDFLAGGSGNDIYIFNRGDGVDVILDDNRPEYESFGSTNIKVDKLLKRMELGGTAQVDAGNDTLKFGAGIRKEDISYAISGKDLIINIAGGSNDAITIVNYLSTNNRVENILLDDGTTIDLFAATQGNDNLIFGDTDTTIDALGGDDIVSTGLGNDTITGGTGNDRLEGGAGDDTYVYTRGDGNDTLTDAAGSDTLKITGALTQDDVIVKLIGKDLIVALKEDGKSFDALTDKITIKNHTNSNNKLETIVFDDGSLLDLGSFDFGTQDNDSFQFDNSNTSINAKGGDDVVSTSSGDDTITGGAGNDTLMGGEGNDTYIYAKGDGKDTITDVSGNDTLKFIGGLMSDDVVVKLIGRDLVIALLEEGKSFEELTDKVVFKNHTNSSNKLETIVFDDGSSINVAALDFGSAENDNLIFGSASITIDAKEGDDIVSTGAGNDSITGGTGNDMLKGGAGSDALIGGLDNDVLQGGRDNDTYIFNRGDGKDTISDYYNGYSIGGGGIEFDQDDANGHVVVKLTGSGLISALKTREIPFSNFANNITDADKNSIDSGDLFIKIVGDDVVIGRLESGRFENWSNKITFHLYVSDNGIMEFGDGVVQGNLFANFVDGDLIIGTDSENQIIFHQNASAGNDTLQFGAGITKDDILYKSIGNDLIFGLKDGDKSFEDLSDTITIKNYVNSNNKIENVRFNDGTLFDFDSTPVATEYDDNLVFVDGDVTVDLLGGNDKVSTSSGNDTIEGGSGDDTIRSGAGRDIITGGLDNDTLDGGAGDDTYIFNRGDAQDTITDSAGNDTIRFGEGIVQSDVLFKQDDFDLRIALREEGDALSDVILIKDWFKTNSNIETVKFADNSTMSVTQIATMLLSSEADTLYSNHGAVMRGGKGNDTYVYKKDDFTVIIDDQFYNKELAINAGSDTLKFEDINRDKVTIGSKGNDLIIKIEATHDTYTELKDYVVIRDWKNPNRGIESIVFGDGEVLAIDKTTTYQAIEFDENWIKGRYYIYGSENNDIKGTEFSEVIESGAGDDIVKALDGNDTLNGGLGNDTLDGGKGNDTYVFNRGDGTDVIRDYEGGVDAIKFGMNISLSDVILQRVNDDLVMALDVVGKTFDELTDKITLSDWFNEETLDHRIELMVFDDAGTLAIADRVILPTVNNDNLEYGDENNHIDALEGDDIIHIGGGDDVLAGNDGNDTLYGEEGNDTLSGDRGTDTLYAAEGDDTYLFGRGDGLDTVIEDSFANWSQTGNDTLKFKDGISSNDVILVQSGDDLIVALKEDGKTFAELTDKITLKNWSLYDEVNSRDLSRAYYTIENFSFSDGTTWNMANIIAHIGSDVGEIIHGFNQNDTLNGQEGDDTLLGYLGDDTYVFNRGDGQDIIYDYGRKGENYSYYDAGNDTLKFGAGIDANDIIMLKEENDVIVYIKNGNQAFEDIEDRFTLKNWFLSNNRIEKMELHDGTSLDYSKYLHAEPTPEDDTLIYGDGDDVIDALAGDDTIVDLGGSNIIDGNSGDDNIKTEDGMDILIGGEGNDTLDAGAGDDTLEGGNGDDIYIFNRGDGADSISDIGGYDTLSFGADITSDDLVLFQDGNNLIIALKENGVEIAELSDKITISNWLDASTRLESIAFNDGTALDVYNMMSMTGTDGDDTIRGIELDDEIYAGEGNDTLSGGTGSDYLAGGEGNDTYLFNFGDGRDTINDVDGIDTLSFGEDIRAEHLWIKQEGDDLIIALREDGVAFADLIDKVIITNWLNTDTRVETFVFNNGTVLNASNIIEMLPSEESDEIYIPDDLAVNIELGAGNDYLEAGSQNDTLSGGKGNDYLAGGAGNDTYLFDIGDGKDTIYDASGIDTLSFGEGITQEDLLFEIDGSTVMVGIREDGVDFSDLSNVLTLDNVLNASNTIEYVSFFDGTRISTSELYGDLSTNKIYGTDGDDYLDGGAEDDTYVGGKGNDRIYDWYGGNDTFIFNRGDGQDVIYNNEGEDTLRFGAGIRVEDLIIRKSENDVIIGLKESEKSFKFLDKVTLKNWYETAYKIENVLLSDGTRIDLSSLLLPTNNDDILRADEIGEKIDALAGNDTIYGSSVDNTLIGGKGYDFLYGEDGNDTYIFNRGDGEDYIYDSQGENILQFGEGINADDLIIQRYNSNVTIAIKEDGKIFSELNDKVTLGSWFSEGGTRANIFFADGTALDTSNFASLGDSYVDMQPKYIYGGYGNDIFNYNRGDGYSVISDYSGNDTLRLGEGISAEDLVIQSEYTNIVIGLKEIGKSFSELSDKVVLSNWFLGEYKIENIIFHDGSVFDTSVFNEVKPDYLHLDNNDNVSHGLGGDDQIYGNGGNDILYGDEGNDYLNGGSGDDSLIGGKGNDSLYEWADSNDTYIFNRGDGQDFIWDYAGNDILQFGEGINVNDLIIQRDGSYNYTGFVIAIKEEGKAFAELADKVIWPEEGEDLNRVSISFSTGENFTFKGLYEQVYGAQDGQVIIGSGEDDTLEGGLGDDIVFGGLGNDTYIFNRGDGHDTIMDKSDWIDSEDVLSFGEGITIDDLDIFRDGESLQINIQGVNGSVSDCITILNWYEDSAIEFIRLFDGSEYSIADYFGVPFNYYGGPIVLDLNHNGITSTELDSSNAYFDYDGDGNREHTGWAEKDDALLVVDLNNDGIINDGSEHFGNFTRLSDGILAKNGYEALAQYDSNSDGVLDNRDEAFGNLLLWKDANQNGKSEKGELTNIQLSTITAILLDSKNGIAFEQRYENGNIILNETNYLSKDGTGIMRDVGFAFDPFDTITNNDTLSKQQYGSVLSGTDGDDTYVYNLGDGKIIIDDNGDGNDTILFDSRILKDQLMVKWESNSNDLLIGIKENIYDISAFSALQNQIRIKNFFNESGSIENIQFSDSTILSKSDLYDILVNTRDTKNLTARTLYENGVLLGGSFNDLLYGTEGQEELQGLGGNDFLKGLSGDDLLTGGEGDDVLQGGLGDDTLIGDAGDDVYIFEKGDGRDVITDFLGNDTIMFGDAISREEVLFEVDGNDLYLRFTYDLNLPLKDRDSIQITNYKDHGFEIENLEFSNGETFSIARLIQINTNQAPEALMVSTHTLQDTRVTTGEVGATDIDGDILTYTVATAATHGVLSIDETGTWSYAATDGYMGSDSAVIMIDDGNRGVITQTLNFEVNVSAPTLGDTTQNLLEDTAVAGALSVVNPIGGTLLYEVLNAAIKGTFYIDALGNWNYDPAANINGDDSVTIKVTNEYGLSTTATLNLAIEAVNDAPITTETESFILKDVREQTGKVEATDVDGDVLSYSVTTQAEHGTVTIDETGAWMYTVNALYMGIDSAVIIVDDGKGGTVTKTLTFDTKVTTPTLTDATSNLLEDNTLNGAFNVVNPIGGVLTYEVLTATTNGDFTVDVDGNWSYNPSQDYNGTDSVLVKVTNEYGLSTTATLNLAIEAVNDAPVTTAEASFTLQDVREQTGAVEASDVDADTLTYSVTTAAQHGTVTIDETGTWSYAATEGYMGIDTAIITVDDGNGGTATQTLTFDLKVSAPTVANVNASLLEDTNVSGALSVLNPIGGALTYEVVSGLSLGALLIDGSGVWSYTPLADANGDEAITIKVTNSYGLSTITTLNLSIEAVNDTPIVTAPIILNAVDEDSGSITITKAQLLANASDIDGDTLNVTGLTTSAGILVDNLNGTWTLSLAADYNGTITLDYNVTDGMVNVAATATQSVIPVNDAPIIVTAPTPAILYAGATVQGVIEASDVDGDILNYSVSSAPAHGALSINDQGQWSYQAERYFAGESEAIITIADGQGGAVSTSLHFTNLMTEDWQYTYCGQELTINDSSGMDTLIMDNISMADLTFLQEGNDLRIDVKDKNDVILTDYFTSLPKGVESLQTKEGPISLIKQKLGATSHFFTNIWGSSQGDLISGSTSSERIYGGSGNDILFGGLGNDTLSGGSGNDLLIGGGGSDSLFGGYHNDISYGDAGDDTLNGYEGDDKLFGGLGNDLLNGDEGNDLLAGGEGTNILRAGDGDDVYLFTKGANTTTVQDKSAPGFFFFGHWIGNDGGNDTVKFGEGITKEDISFLMSGHDLVLQYGTGELMTVKNQDNRDTKIEKFELDDGSYLTNTDMDQIIQQLNAYKADHGISIANNDQLRQNQAMMNIVASGWHQ